MKLPDNIEKKLREIARKRKYSEVEYIHLRDFVLNYAIAVKNTVETINKKAA